MFKIAVYLIEPATDAKTKTETNPANLNYTKKDVWTPSAEWLRRLGFELVNSRFWVLYEERQAFDVIYDPLQKEWKMRHDFDTDKEMRLLVGGSDDLLAAIDFVKATG